MMNTAKPNSPQSDSPVKGSGDTRWKPGQSGNPKGRPPGIADRRTEYRKQLGEKSQEVVKRVIDACLNDNDMTACRIIIDRTIPRLRDKAEASPFPLDTSASLAEQAAQVMQAVSEGELDPQTGKSLLDGVGALAHVIEIDELAKRLDKLEALANEKDY